MSVVVKADVGFWNFHVNLSLFPSGVKRNLDFTQIIPTPADVFVLWHNTNKVYMGKFACNKFYMS